jgi:hypothetical protein
MSTISTAHAITINNNQIKEAPVSEANREYIHYCSDTYFFTVLSHSFFIYITAFQYRY